jgi:hypothetical protein
VDTAKKIIDLLRGKGADTPSGRPLDQRRRGYQLAAKEAKLMGERVPSYEEWLAAQPAEMK